MLIANLDSLLEFANNLFVNGISWGGLIAFLIFLNKIQRANQYRTWNENIANNQKIIMEKLGVGEQWNGVHSSKCMTNTAGRRKTRFTLRWPGNITAPIAGRFTNLITRRKNMNKWLNPSLLTVVVTLIATYLNQQFGWKLDPAQIVGILLVVGHYAVTQEIVHAKQKANGAFAGYTLNSSKLVIVILGSLAIGFCTVVGIQATPADIIAVVTVIVAFVTGRGYHDVKQTGGTNAQFTDTSGPTK